MWFRRKAEGPAAPTPAPAGPEVDAAQPPEAASAEAGAKKGWLGRAWDYLNKPVFDQDEAWAIKTRERIAATRQALVHQVRSLVTGRGAIDDDLLEDLEAILLGADLGVGTSDAVLADLRRRAKEEGLKPEGLPTALAEILEARMGEALPFSLDPEALNVVLVVGVNGVGKTTTVGKLAARLQLAGHPTVIAAADTFRAAAIEQLGIWSERAGVELVRHQHGSDAAAVVFDALQAAKARQKRVVLIDTAGRLHNKANLMTELAKIRRIVDRETEGSPAKVQSLLVLDATTGQNGLRQAQVFAEAAKLTGVILTKLDGTAKGGVVFAIRHDLGLPVQLVGLGEQLEDLGDFDPKAFVAALFERDAQTQIAQA